MILIALGRWNHSVGRWFIRERIWWRDCPWGHTYCWTPFVRVRRRYEFAMHIAYSLPRRVVNWAIIRAWAEATTGPWSHVDPSDVTVSEMLKRWKQEEDDNTCTGNGSAEDCTGPVGTGAKGKGDGGSSRTQV